MASETLQIVVSATDNASGTLGKITSTIADMGKVAGGILLADVINKVSDAISTTLTDGSDMLIFLERMNMAFTQMVASDLRASDSTMSVADSMKYAAGQAEVLSQWMTELAIQSPFQTADISKTFRIAKMYGFTASEAQRLTQDMVDMAAATGSSPFMMERLALALGQIGTRGKLAGQEIRQLAEAGFPVGEMMQMLADKFNVTIPELQRMQEKGLIPAKEALLAITEVMETNFGGAAKQQMNLFAGLMSSFSDIREIGGARFIKGFLAPFKTEITNFIGSIASPDFFNSMEKAGYMASAVFKSALSIGKIAVSEFIGLFGTLPSKISSFVSTVVSLIKNGMNPIAAIESVLFSKFGVTAQRAFSALVNVASAAFNIITQGMRQLFSGNFSDAIRTFFGDDVANAVLPILQSIAAFINSTLIPILNRLFGETSNNATTLVQRIFAIAAGFFLLKTALGGISFAVTVFNELSYAVGFLGRGIGMITTVLSPLTSGIAAFGSFALSSFGRLAYASANLAMVLGRGLVGSLYYSFVVLQGALSSIAPVIYTALSNGLRIAASMIGSQLFAIFGPLILRMQIMWTTLGGSISGWIATGMMAARGAIAGAMSALSGMMAVLRASFIGTMISGIGGFISGIAGSIAGMASGILGALSGVFAIVSSFAAGIASLFGGLIAAVGGFLAAISPVVIIVGAVIAAIVLLGLAIVAIQNRTQIFNGIMEGLNTTLSNVVVFFDFFWQALTTGIIPALGALLGVLGEVIVGFADFALKTAGVSGGIQEVGNAFNWLGGVIVDSFVAALQSAKQLLVIFIASLIDVLRGVGQDTTQLENSLRNLVSSSSMGTASGKELGNALNDVGSAASGAFSTVGSLASGIFGLSNAHMSAALAAYEQADATRKLAMATSALRALGMSQREAMTMFGGDWQSEVVKMAYGSGYASGEEYLAGLQSGMDGAADEAKNKIKRLMSEVRSIVEKALAPTEVTEKDQRRYEIQKRISELQGQLDGAGRGRTAQLNSEIDALGREAAALGPYQDKWDEFRRRVEAVATGTDIGQFGEKFAAQLSAVKNMFPTLGLDQIAEKFKDFSLFADKVNLGKMIDMGVVDLSGIEGQIDAQINAIVGKANLMKEAFDRVWSSMSEQKKIDLANALGLDAESVASTTAGANQAFAALSGQPIQAAQTNISGVGNASKQMSDALTSVASNVQSLPANLTTLSGSLKTFGDGLTKDVQSPISLFEASMASISASFAALSKDVPETIKAVGVFPETLAKISVPINLFLGFMNAWVTVNGEILEGIIAIEKEIENLAGKLANLDLGPFQRHSPSMFEQSLMGSNEHLTELLRLIPMVNFNNIRFTDFGLMQLNAESFANILQGVHKGLADLEQDPTKWDEVSGKIQNALGIMNAIRDSGAEIPEDFKKGILTVIDDMVNLGKIAPDVAKQMREKVSGANPSETASAAAGDAASNIDFTPVVKAVNQLGTEIKTMFDGVMAHFDTIANMVASTFDKIKPIGIEEAWISVARAIELAGNKLLALQLPSFLVHHSPSELELALW